VLEPVFEVLFPLVSEVKSSLSKITPPPPPPPDTIKVTVLFPVPAELVAEIVTVDVPADEGVPEINPVEVLTVNPAGNPVAPKEVGLLFAVIW
jgi:hypothetical protein